MNVISVFFMGNDSFTSTFLYIDFYVFKCGYFLFAFLKFIYQPINCGYCVKPWMLNECKRVYFHFSMFIQGVN